MRILLALALLLPMQAAQAVAPKNIEIDWTYEPAQTVSSAGSSTTSVTGVGGRYCVYGDGAAVKFTVHQTTRTYSSHLDYSAIRSSSTVLTIPANVAHCDDFWALTVDPSIVVHNFTTSATHYITVSYGKRKEP